MAESRYWLSYARILPFSVISVPYRHGISQQNGKAQFLLSKTRSGYNCDRIDATEMQIKSPCYKWPRFYVPDPDVQASGKIKKQTGRFQA